MTAYKSNNILKNMILNLLIKCENLNDENDSIYEDASIIKNKKHTRSNSKLIREYKTRVRQNSFEILRILTEILYLVNEYSDVLSSDKFNITFRTEIEHLSLSIEIKNYHVYQPFSKEDTSIINSFNDELRRAKLRK
jgi:hypothetical protein